MAQISFALNDKWEQQLGEVFPDRGQISALVLGCPKLCTASLRAQITIRLPKGRISED